MKFFRYIQLVLTLLAIHFSALSSIAEEFFVEISPRGLFPAYRQVVVGDTVTWYNFNPLDYTIISLDDAWSDILLPSLTSASHTFSSPGTYQYFAESRNFFGSFGIIEVLESWPPPENDKCAGAIPLSPYATYFQSTAHATSDEEPRTICDQPVGNGVWYSFRSTTAGTVTINICGSDFDTLIGIYVADCGSFSHLSPIPIACNGNDDLECEGGQSSVNFYAQAHVTYRVFVAGRDGQTGRLEITATEALGPPPFNDICAQSIAMAPDKIYSVNTYTATSQGDPTPACEEEFRKGVWYTFTPIASGEVAIYTYDSDFSPILTVYTGSCESMTEVLGACSDSNKASIIGAETSVSFSAVRGTTYYILLGSYSRYGGNTKISLMSRYGRDPVNDGCHSPISMTPEVTYEQNTTFATTIGDPLPECYEAVSGGVWYLYRPQTSGAVTISTCGSDFRTVLSLYTGNCLDPQPLAYGCNSGNGPACTGTNASIKFMATAFTDYKILVGGQFGAVGNLKIKASAPVAGVAPANDLCGQAIPIVPNQLYSIDITYAATSNDSAGDCEDSTPERDVWFTYKPEKTGHIILKTEGSGFKTAIMAYDGSCNTKTPIGHSCVRGYDTSSFIFIIANHTYQIRVGGFGGESGLLRLRLEEHLVEPSWPDRPLPFDLGNSIAQTDSNVVHFVDSSNNRLLSLDTDTGNFISSIQLQGKPSGLMAFSLNQKELYVPLHTNQKIQVITLAGLSTKDIVPLNLSPKSVSVGFDEMLYVIASNKVVKIDPVTGFEIGILPGIFEAPIIKANRSGTKIYVMETGPTGNPGLVDEYQVIPSALPEYTTNFISHRHTGVDFLVADDINQIFMSPHNSDTVFVQTLTGNHVRNLWSSGVIYNVAIACITNLPNMYVASSGGDFTIATFNKITGTASKVYYSYEEGFPSGQIHNQGMHLTPNGRVFYTRGGRRFGLIGATSLSTNLPPTKEWIDAGTNLTVMATVPFTLQAVAPSPTSGEVFAWSKIEGPDDALFTDTNSLSPSVYISTPGQYTFQVSRAKGSFVSRDRVLVTVTAKPIRILETSVDDEGRFVLLFDASPSLYTIEASTNLVDWETIAHAFNAEGQFTIQDPMTNRTQRFYRIRRTE